jgi:hypothetical protein
LCGFYYKRRAHHVVFNNRLLVTLCNHIVSKLFKKKVAQKKPSASSKCRMVHAQVTSSRKSLLYFNGSVDQSSRPMLLLKIHRKLWVG